MFRGLPQDSPDTALLERFAQHRDESAFAGLVQRHGRLVWSVSLRVTRQEQDAEDVYQATFLLLARKAASIRKAAALGSWLYGVAHRLALRARCDAARRRHHEQRAQMPSAAADDLTWRELREVLDLELARLPHKYRAPLELCYLGEVTQEEAARQLGWTARLVRYRLERARKLLRVRLSKRGLPLLTALASAVMGSTHASAAPPAITAAVVHAAAPFATRRTVAGTVSAAALVLAEGGASIMFSSKLYLVAAALVALLVLGGTGLFGGRAAKEAAPAIAAATDGGDRAGVDRYGDPLPPGALTRLGTVRYRFSAVGSTFLADGTTVVSVQQGNAIQLWDARTGRLLREIDTGRFSTGWGAVAVAHDRSRIAVSGSLSDDANGGMRGAVRVYDLVTGKLLRAVDEVGPLQGAVAMALTPDGKVLFGVDRNGQLQVLEVATGKEVLRQKLPADVERAMALSPDGSTLALHSGPNTGKLYVWKWQTGDGPRAIENKGRRGRSLAFSWDGKLLAECGDHEPDVRVFDVATGRLLRKLDLPDLGRFAHYDVAFAPNGKLLAASGSWGLHSRAVHLWEPATGKFVQRLDLPAGPLAFSPDSTLLVAGSRVWDLAAARELSANDEAHESYVERIITARKDLVVTASHDDTVRIWDAATGKQRHRLVLHGWVRGIALSPDASKLVSISMDDSVCLWDVATGKQIYRLIGHGRMGSAAQAAAFTPDGKSFFTWAGSDMNLRKWDVQTGKALFEHAIRPTGVAVPTEEDEPSERDLKMLVIVATAFTPDTTRLVIDVGGRSFSFDTNTGKEVRTLSTDRRLAHGMAVSPDGKLLVTSTYGKPIEIKLPGGGVQSASPREHPLIWCDLATGEHRKELLVNGEEPGPIAFSPDGKLLATSSGRSDPCIRLLEAATGRVVHKISGFCGVVQSLAFMPDGNRLVSGMQDSSALVWDLRNDKDR
jgi:RNA polymerase sigma factor (sigma-70 family)